MDSPEAARAECPLKKKVSESVGTLCSTLAWEVRLVYGTCIIYALATFAALAGALR
jgi:hypothetical protein